MLGRLNIIRRMGTVTDNLLEVLTKERVKNDMFLNIIKSVLPRNSCFKFSLSLKRGNKWFDGEILILVRSIMSQRGEETC